jgi:hypothetical protein
MSGEFRQYLFPHDHPRLAEVRGLDPYTYREAARKEGTFTGDLVQGWTPLYLNEFRGITEDGVLRADVHPFALPLPGEEAPVAAMVAAAHDLLAALGDEDRTRVSYAVDAVEWQTWANPEFMAGPGHRRVLRPAAADRTASRPTAGDRGASGRDLVLLDRRAPRRRRLLLPRPVPGDHRRARPPLRRLPRLRRPEAVPHPHRPAHSTRQRLRPSLGPAVAAGEAGSLSPGPVSP